MQVLIIGGGPAGVTAGLYTARAGLETTIIYKDVGALRTADRIGNFYGLPNIKGADLFEIGLSQAAGVGVHLIRSEVVGLRTDENGKVTVETGKISYTPKAVLLATGVGRISPKIPGLAELEGHGVSYCAICDAFFYRGKNVTVLGNSAYALHEVADLLPVAASVTLLTNGKEPTLPFPDGVEIVREKINRLTSKTTKSAFGLENTVLSTIEFNSGASMSIDGLFVAEGTAGGGDLARKVGAECTPAGDVVINENKRTSLLGLWAAGDCTGGLKQISKAVCEGTIAGLDIIKFCRENGN